MSQIIAAVARHLVVLVMHATYSRRSRSDGQRRIAVQSRSRAYAYASYAADAVGVGTRNEWPINRVVLLPKSGLGIMNDRNQGNTLKWINGGHLYSKCGLRFALAQSIAKLGFCVGTQKLFLGEPCQKHFWT